MQKLNYDYWMHLSWRKLPENCSIGNSSDCFNHRHVLWSDFFFVILSVVFSHMSLLGQIIYRRKILAGTHLFKLPRYLPPHGLLSIESGDPFGWFRTLLHRRRKAGWRWMVILRQTQVVLINNIWRSCLVCPKYCLSLWTSIYWAIIISILQEIESEVCKSRREAEAVKVLL